MLWNPGMVHNLKKYIVIQMTDAQLFEIILISNLRIDAILQEIRSYSIQLIVSSSVATVGQKKDLLTSRGW